MSKYKICIDAGHGGRDQGAVNESRNEKDDVLKIALRLGEVLRANGFDIYYTRTDDIFEIPAKKADTANAGNGDYLISLHRNISLSPKASGVEAYVYGNQGKIYEIANQMNNNLSKIGYTNLGIKTKPGLTMLNQTKMPALSIEIGFISAEKDNLLLDKKFQMIVNGIAKGITEALGMEFKTL